MQIGGYSSGPFVAIVQHSILIGPHFCVEGVWVGYELGVRPPLCHVAITEDEDLLGIHDGGESVGNK